MSEVHVTGFSICFENKDRGVLLITNFQNK